MKKFLSFFLVFVILISVVPLTAFADVQEDRVHLLSRDPVWSGTSFSAYPFNFDIPAWNDSKNIPSGYVLSAIICTVYYDGLSYQDNYMRIEFLYCDSSVKYFTGSLSGSSFTVSFGRAYTIQHDSKYFDWSGAGGSAYRLTGVDFTSYQCLYSNLPIKLNDGTELAPSNSPFFNMRSTVSSTGIGFFDVAYTGSADYSHDVIFYACTYSDWISWKGSATSNYTPVTFGKLLSDPDFYDKNWFPYFSTLLNPDLRYSPISSSKSKNLSGMPSPVCVVGSGVCSRSHVAAASVDFKLWRDNASLGGVYSSTDIVVFAKCMYKHTDLVTGNVVTTPYFCYQRFDISSFINDLYVPNAMVTDIEPIQPPDDGSVSDLQSLAQYMRYLYQTTNNNNTTIYNNYMSEVSSLPWSGWVSSGVVSGLNDFLPTFSGELDTVFTGLFNEYTVPDPSDIGSLKADIDTKEAAFKHKFYWVTQIQSEVHFVTSTVISAGDAPVVVAVHADYDSPSASRHVDYGNITLFDASKVDPSIVAKAKDIITVFLSIGLLWYIFRTLPSTIGNTPNE